MSSEHAFTGTEDAVYLLGHHLYFIFLIKHWHLTNGEFTVSFHVCINVDFTILMNCSNSKPVKASDTIEKLWKMTFILSTVYRTVERGDITVSLLTDKEIILSM